MFKHHRIFRRAAALLLAMLLLVQPLAALAQEDAAPITHIAKSTVALKVRRAPDKDALGCDSIPRGSYVYILDYGNEWCRVRTDYAEGYVLTKYLADVIAQDGAPEVSDLMEEERNTEPVGEVQPGFTTNPSNFRESYYSHALVNARIYEAPSVNSRVLDTALMYEQVVVSEVSGDWCLARYKGRVYGYMLNETLFKWDRIDPYAGIIPGQDIWPYLAFVNRTVTIRDLETNEELKTINPGSAICVGEKDELGRYPLPYHRTVGYVMEDEIAYLMPVVDWQNAESGDLISTMTTYFAVGKASLQYQGRNWNIRLAGTYITNTILQPGQEYEQNHVIGPYKQSTGYKSAPIMSDEALHGYGGGTCQVNTTFYIATIRLPLLVKHRRVHADVGMYYAKQGFDAAVGGGDINLRMVNTMPYAIRYQFLISDGVLTCNIYKV